jgi:hypothetical protein
MGKARVLFLYKRMSPEGRSTFNRWLKANMIVGLILMVGIVARRWLVPDLRGN